jgi:transposase-like protein
MPRKQTARSTEFKANVALAAIQEQKTVQQLAGLYGIHPSQLQQWKKHLLAGASSLFETADRVQVAVAQQAREAELFEQIGRLNMELDWLKKKVAGLG